MRTYIKTRKLSMRQMEAMEKWLDDHTRGSVLIRGAPHKRFIQQYVGEKDGGWPIHEISVEFSDPETALAFRDVWS